MSFLAQIICSVECVKERFAQLGGGFVFCQVYDVENLKFQCGQNLPDRKYIVHRSANPNCRIVFHLVADKRKPFHIEFIKLINVRTFVPITFVDADDFAVC